MYEVGQLVYPTDLPRRIPCRIAVADSCDVPGRCMQILQLEPLEGPWPPGTLLIRVDDSVRPWTLEEVEPPPRLQIASTRRRSRPTSVFSRARDIRSRHPDA